MSKSEERGEHIMKCYEILRNAYEQDRYGQGAIMWVGITENGRTLLHIFEQGTVTS